MLKLYCHRYIKDRDQHLPLVMGAYNSTRHATNGVSLFLMLTGKEKNTLLVYFHQEYENRYTIPRDYVTRHIEKQMNHRKAINELVKARTARAQMKQKLSHEKRMKGSKAF